MPRKQGTRSYLLYVFVQLCRIVRIHTMKPNSYAVLIADVIGSSERGDLRGLLGQRLAMATRAHGKAKLVRLPYAITAGDEFQTILGSDARIPEVIIDLRTRLRPLQVRMGIGIGTVAGRIQAPVNRMGGEAFQLARRALERIKGSAGSKFEVLTSFESRDKTFDATANLIYALHDTLVLGSRRSNGRRSRCFGPSGGWRKPQGSWAGQFHGFAQFEARIFLADGRDDRRNAERNRRAFWISCTESYIKRQLHENVQRKRSGSGIMEMLTRTILALYLAHLLTDFVLQTSQMVKQKRSGAAVGYAKHGAVYFVCAEWRWRDSLCRGCSYSWRFQTAMPVLTLAHLGIDWCKIVLSRRTAWAQGTAAFAIDQWAHFMTIVAAGCWIARVGPGAVLLNFFGVARAPSDRVLLVMVVYVGVIFGGGYLIRFLTKPLLKDLQMRESPLQLSNAGMYIGWLERFVVMTALFLRSPATAGLILAAKSIARYPEFKREQFAEYFLIGTLLSLSAAIVGGVILLKAFYGSPLLPQ